MNYLKIFVSFLFFVLLVTLGLSFFLSTNQKVERTVIINASAPVIYNHLIKLENFNKTPLLYIHWAEKMEPSAPPLPGKAAPKYPVKEKLRSSHWNQTTKWHILFNFLNLKKEKPNQFFCWMKRIKKLHPLPGHSKWPRPVPGIFSTCFIA